MPFTARQKAKCVLWFAKLESVTSVQRRFRQEYRVRKNRNYKSIMLWYRTFTWMTHFMATGAVEVDQLCGLQIL